MHTACTLHARCTRARSRRRAASPCSGHADAGLGAQKTLGFTSEDTGEIATVRPDELAEMLGAHSPRSGGRLELVFLNGCCSEELGRAVHAAGVPVVVCWSTLAENSAARIFAMIFFKTYMRGKDYRQVKTGLVHGAWCMVHGACMAHARWDARARAKTDARPIPFQIPSQVAS
jgi:hypothetical protein